MSTRVGPGLTGRGGTNGAMTSAFAWVPVDGWRVHGDVDGGDGGRWAGAAVVAVEVAGCGAFDLAGAVAGPPCGQQGGQNGPADNAGQVSGSVRTDPAGRGEFLTRGLERGGEAGPVGIGAGAGLHGGDHRHAQQLVEQEQGPCLNPAGHRSAARGH